MAAKIKFTVKSILAVSDLIKLIPKSLHDVFSNQIAKSPNLKLLSIPTYETNFLCSERMWEPFHVRLEPPHCTMVPMMSFFVA
jgi:hypothetical protein